MRADDDPLTYAYLEALGCRIGVEMSVNTSFNVAGPIAQTPQQAIDTLRRSKGLDAVLPLGEIGTELPLAEIYDGVEFSPEPEEGDVA